MEEKSTTNRKSNKLTALLIIAGIGILVSIYLNTPLREISLRGMFESKELTNAKVIRAFEKVKGVPGGTVKVVGIRTGQNFAGMTIVDVSLTNFMWRSDNRSEPNHAGPATGYFSGYADGRYILHEFELTGHPEHPKFTAEKST